MARPSGISRFLPSSTFLLALSVLVPSSAFLATPAAAQLPAAGEIVPQGFLILGQVDLGGTQVIEAKKRNESCPKPYDNDTIQFKATWSQNPMADQIMEIMAKAPEDGPSSNGPITEEPCGKEAHEGGIVSCRRRTKPWMDMGEGPALVTYDVAWMGTSPTGLVGVEIIHLCGSPGDARAWIDAAIPKMKAAR